MAYEATVWKTGDLISAEKLNKMEMGIQNEQVGPQGEPGTPGTPGEAGKDGIRGSKWFSGTGISGGSGIEEQVFASSGVTDALINDRYLNTDEGNVYICAQAGDADTATWSYELSIMGPKGDAGDAGADGAGLTGEAQTMEKLAGSEEAAEIATKVNAIIDVLVARGICTSS